MKKLLVSLTCALAVSACSCGDISDMFVQPTEKVEKQDDPEVRELQRTVFALQGTIAALNQFAAHDFTNCDNALPPFEQKVCKIAQTATAEAQVTYFSSLADLAKIMQTQLYGEDCLNDTSIGCPEDGSVTNQLAVIEAAQGRETTRVDALIVALRGDLALVQTSVSQINARLNNFDGTAKSLENVIQAIQVELNTLAQRIAKVEAVLDTAKLWTTVRPCSDVETSGPVYEAMLLSGDRKQLLGYAEGRGNNTGLTVMVEAGVTGSGYYETSLNTRSCKFRVYDLQETLKICWLNTDRGAIPEAIDNACGNGTGSQTAACTCQ